MSLPLKIIFLYAAFVLASVSHAQDTIDLSGSVRLDFGVASKNYDIDITVTNYSFLVLSVDPFIIQRNPISSVTERVTINQGQSSTDYLINGISTDAADYVIDFQCNDCDGVLSQQYYTANGNVFFLTSSAYIDPNDFPSNLNFRLTSATAISGVVSLVDDELAKQNLFISISVFDTDNPSRVLQRTNLMLAEGSNSTTYSIDEIIRKINRTGFTLQLDCFNCLANSVLTINYPDTLDASVDHTNINFALEFTDTVFLPAIYRLLLGKEN